MGLDREKVLREGLAGRVGRELAKSATTMDVRRHGHVVRARANCEAFSSAPFSQTKWRRKVQKRFRHRH